MLSIISKKYTQALIDSDCDLDEALRILKGIADVIKDKKNADIIASPFLSKTQKERFYSILFKVLIQRFKTSSVS